MCGYKEEINLNSIFDKNFQEIRFSDCRRLFRGIVSKKDGNDSKEDNLYILCEILTCKNKTCNNMHDCSDIWGIDIIINGESYKLLQAKIVFVSNNGICLNIEFNKHMIVKINKNAENIYTFKYEKNTIMYLQSVLFAIKECSSESLSECLSKILQENKDKHSTTTNSNSKENLVEQFFKICTRCKVLRDHLENNKRRSCIRKLSF
ncbi:hypothetical protein [Anaerocellum danielii]|uniref:Uncharacterized protein n=1 Tax=Anaerocellum danielii TaxID=1387557 RepID=A0ABZ0U211_9FIRM|nr:hypothetical protein [Caldicellulosiruptor danielii]WPX09502.1 hypothetical protein SOJ16_000714 [Caldicellulosiruptor danielii]